MPSVSEEELYVGAFWVTVPASGFIEVEETRSTSEPVTVCEKLSDVSFPGLFPLLVVESTAKEPLIGWSIQFSVGFSRYIFK